MRWHVALLALFVALTLMSTSALADLIGSNVTATLYYPNLSTVYAGPSAPVVVGAGIEFPSLAFDGTLDVSGTQIIWTATYAPSISYGPGAFNGFDLLFSGAPTITGVTLDAATTLVPVSFSSSGNDVKLNLAGLTAVAGQKTILNVQTSAVPEPRAGFVALILLMLGLALRRIRPASVTSN